MKKKAAAAGGKLPMVMKGGKKVPFFAADGVDKDAKRGAADKVGRAVKRKTADAKGRAMKGK